jgi:hypothetical protein
MKIKQKLSDNIICNWEIYKLHNIIEEYYILSCSFFKTNTLYKDINIYIDGLIYIINNYKYYFPNYRLRIYYDNSVNDIIQNLNIDDNIELYKYDIDIFKDNIYHKGTIGTFMRFLPLFNLEYHKVNVCIVIDIDNKFNSCFTKLIKYFNDNNIKIAYRYRPCYICNKRILYTKNKFPIIASFIYQTIQLPYHILSNFLEKLYINNNIKIIKNINKSGIINIYEYGIDEYFLNKVYIKYLYKNNINILLILFNHIDIVSGFNKFFNYYCNTLDKTTYLWNICVNFFKIIKININKIYEINNENILHFFNSNLKMLENKLLLFLKNNNNHKYLKNFILYELNKTNNKKLKILFNCILINLNIHLDKINLLEVNNNILNNIFINL